MIRIRNALMRQSLHLHFDQSFRKIKQEFFVFLVNFPQALLINRDEDIIMLSVLYPAHHLVWLFNHFQYFSQSLIIIKYDIPKKRNGSINSSELFKVIFAYPYLLL